MSAVLSPTGQPIGSVYEPGDIRLYSPESSVATALSRAIAAAMAANRPVVIDDDYDLGSTVTIASLSGKLRIKGGGTITYTGSATEYMLLISATNGHDVEFEKGLTFDCGQIAAVGIRCDNASASMAEANIGRFICNARVLNGYMPVGGTVGSSGIVVVGGFSEVILDGSVFRNMSREAAAGVVGSQGSSGALITYSSINAYPRKVTMRGGVIDTITSEDALGSGDDFDYDGIIISGPLASDNGSLRVPMTALVEGVTFKNVRGRCVKSQVDGFSTVRDVTVIRDAVLPYGDATDFDFQRGGFLLDGLTEYIYTSAGASTFGASHAIVGWAPDQLATIGDGSGRARNITVHNHVPHATDTLPNIALVINGDATKRLPGFSLQNVAVIGGRVDRALRCTAASTVSTEFAVFRVEGVEAALTTSLVNFAIAVDTQVKVFVDANVCTDSTLTPDLLELASVDQPDLYEGDNIGFS
jgi:hypothetical protein